MRFGPRELLFAAFIGVLILVVAPAARAASAQPQPGVVLALKGQVEIRSAGEAAWHNANLRERLQPGARIRTGAKSSALIEISTRNRLALGELTELGYDEATARREVDRAAGAALFSASRRNVYSFRVSQSSGRVSAVLRGLGKSSRLELKTPIATAGVRGTYFVSLLAPQAASGSFFVLEGLVHIVSRFVKGGAADVAAGQKIDVGPQAGGSPEPIAATQNAPLTNEMRQITDGVARDESTVHRNDNMLNVNDAGASSGGCTP